MSAFSYKEMLTNQLMVFINQRIATSKDMQDKVNSLTEEKRKKFQQKIVESIINKAKSLAEIQGTQYLGMMGDSGEKEMISWVDTFFDEFEANMKDPEPKPKAKTPAKATRTSTTVTKTGVEKKITHDVEEGFFGLEVKIDKKTVLSKDDFISKIYSENKGKEITFTWKDDKVEVVIKDKAEKKPEVTQQELDNEEIQNIDEEDEETDIEEEEDEDEEDEEDEETDIDEEDEDEEDEEEDGLF